MALGLVLITVTYGHLLIEPLFDFTGHVIPRTVLLLVVALTPRDADCFSLDYWLARGSSRRVRPRFHRVSSLKRPQA